MKRESKLARQKKAARAIAEIIYASLKKLPLEEQEKRIRAMQKTKIQVQEERKWETVFEFRFPQNGEIFFLPLLMRPKKCGK